MGRELSKRRKINQAAEFLIFSGKVIEVAIVHNPAAANEKQAIAFSNGAQAMGDDDHRLFALQAVDGIGNFEFRLIVERRRRFVEYQNGRIEIQRAGNPDALDLSAGRS